MAMRLFSLCSPPVLTLNQDSDRRPRKSGLKMCSNIDPISVNNLQIRSFDHKNKVFEDISAGILCYEDENGEIICEGYDEGPRFHQQIPRLACNSSAEVEMVDLLQRCWLQSSDENEIMTADTEIAGQKKFNCNGFRKL